MILFIITVNFTEVMSVNKDRTVHVYLRFWEAISFEDGSLTVDGDLSSLLLPLGSIHTRNS